MPVPAKMGKLKQKKKTVAAAAEKTQQQSKIKKNKKMNKANKQKTALIKENVVSTAKASPPKVKEPKSNLTTLVSPVTAGKVNPKKEPGEKKKKSKKPKPPANGDVEKTQPNKNAQKPVPPTKPGKTSKKKKTDETSEKKPYDPEDKTRTVFVGNLPPNTKSIQLKKFFLQFGEVKSIRFRTADGKVLFKHKMRREAPALNAYVVLKSDEAIGKALKESGCEFKGRHIRITKAGKSSGDIDSKRVIFVGNLKFSATDEKLYEIFSTCGEIEYVRTLQGEKGCKGIAYVGFKKPDAVTLALELNNTMLDERPIHVERYSQYKQECKRKQKDEQAEQVQKLTGAAKRIAGKSKKLGKSANNPKGGKAEQAPKESKKKSDFRGVKVDIKKKPKKKKKPSAMDKLATKIAPKS